MLQNLLPLPCSSVGGVPGGWFSNRSSKYALGARPWGGAERLRLLSLACVVRPAVLSLPSVESAPLLGGRLGDPGGLGPIDLALEYR